METRKESGNEQYKGKGSYEALKEYRLMPEAGERDKGLDEKLFA
jgi:hypothetical protein